MTDAEREEREKARRNLCVVGHCFAQRTSSEALYDAGLARCLCVEHLRSFLLSKQAERALNLDLSPFVRAANLMDWVLTVEALHTNGPNGRLTPALPEDAAKAPPAAKAT